jgi:hypothetical protein
MLLNSKYKTLLIIKCTFIPNSWYFPLKYEIKIFDLHFLKNLDLKLFYFLFFKRLLWYLPLGKKAFAWFFSTNRSLGFWDCYFRFCLKLSCSHTEWPVSMISKNHIFETKPNTLFKLCECLLIIICHYQKKF